MGTKGSNKVKTISCVDILRYTGSKQCPAMQAYVADGYETVMYYLPRGSFYDPDLKLDEEYESLTNNPGIYCLINSHPDVDSGATAEQNISIYVGKADMGSDGRALYKRIAEHLNKNDAHIDWDVALAFSNKSCGNSWDAAVTKSIEATLIDELRAKTPYVQIIQDDGSIIEFSVYDDNRKEETPDNIDPDRVTSRINAMKVLIANSNVLNSVDLEATKSSLSLHEAVAKNFVIQQKNAEEARSKEVEQSEIQKIHKEFAERAYEFVRKERNGYNKYIESILGYTANRYDNGRLETRNGIYEMPGTPELVTSMVNKIKPYYFSADTKFLDPASTSGEYLLEILDRMMNDESLPISKEIPNRADRLKHVVSHCLYGLTTSNVALQLNQINFATRINEYKASIGSDAADLYLYPNIKYIDNAKYESTQYIDLVKRGLYDNGKPTMLYTEISKAFGFSDSALECENENSENVEKTEYKRDNTGFNTVKTGDKMKFDIVIGNPPYQEDTGGGNSGAMPLYDKFVLLANEIASKQFILVIPSRWFVSSRSECEAVRNVLLTDNTRYIRDFKDASEVFDGVQIAGGICYFSTDKQYHGPCTVDTGTVKWTETLNKEMFIRSKEVSSIFNKIKSLGNFRVLTTQKMNPFGLKRADCGIPDKKSDTEVKVYSSGKYIGYIERSEVHKGCDLIDKYKVITDYGTSGVRDTFRTGLVEPGAVCTLTYYVVRYFDTEQEAQNCKKYLKTRFVRSLIDATVCNATITEKNFVLIPDQNFKTPSNLEEGFEIDWSKSVSEIDQQLFKKYNLSEDEINYIQSVIKPLE